MSTNHSALSKNNINVLKFVIFAFILFIITINIIFYDQTSIHDDQMLTTSQVIVNYFYDHLQY